jgi:hypothetical protein
VNNIFVTSTDSFGASGSAMAYAYKNENKVYKENVGDPQAVAQKVAASKESVIVVCVNDFVGSGTQAIEGLRKVVIPSLDEADESWRERVKLVLASVAGFDDGLARVDAEFGGEVHVICARVLSDNDRAFHTANGLFSDPEELLEARTIAEEIGRTLERNHPLGWEAGEGLIVFPQNVPNYTLPILWKRGAKYNGQEWFPLFPRG